MAEFSATDAAIEGFRLAGRKPAAMLIWSLAWFLFTVVSGVVLVVLVGSEMQSVQQQADVPPTDTAQAMTYMSALLRVEGVRLLLNVPWAAVMACAVYRALLRPSERGLGYLKLGMDELRMIGLALLVGVLSFVLLFVVVFVDVILTALVGGLLGALGHSAPAGGVDPAGFMVGVLGAAAPVAALFWVLVRISLAGPMTFAEKRLRLFQSWKLTRGHFWALFGAYSVATILFLVTTLVGLALAILIGGLITGIGFVPMGQVLWRPDWSSLQAWLTWPRLAVMGLSSLYMGLLTAIMNAPAAAAYLMLAGPTAPQAAPGPVREPTGPWG